MDLTILGKYANELVSLSKNLTLLMEEVKLRQYGFSVFYAVDFAEVFARAHPLSDSDEDSSLGFTEEEVERRLRRHVALGFLFDVLPDKLILLPPYLVELRNHLVLLRRNLWTGHGQNILRARVEQFATQDRATEIDAIASKVIEKKQVLQSDWFALVDYVREHYKTLFTLLWSRKEDQTPSYGLNVIGSLIREKLVSLKDLWPEIVEQLDPIEIDSMTDPWIQDFYHVRKEPEARSHAIYLDAAAGAFIRKVNQQLISKKLILLFITHSKSMLNVFEGQLAVDVPTQEHPFEILRRPDHLVTLLIHTKGEMKRMNSRETLDELEKTETMIQIYTKLVKKAKNLQRHSTTQRGDTLFTIYNAAKQLEALAPRMNSFENLSLVLKDDPALTRFIQEAKDTKSWFAELAANILQATNDPIAESYIEQELAREVSDLTEFGEQAIGLLDKVEMTSQKLFKRFKRYEAVSFAEERNTLPLAFQPGREKWLYNINFFSDEIRKLVLDIHTNPHSWASDQVAILLSKKNPQSQLLLVYLLVLLSPEDFSSPLNVIEKTVQEIDSLIQRCKNDHKRVYELMKAELRFLQTIVHRLSGKISEAIQSCEQSLLINSNDPRFWKEEALLLMRAVETSRTNMQGVRYSIDDVLSAINKAKKLVSVDGDPINDSLRAHIANNITLYYLIRGAPGDLSRAKEEFEVLKKLVPKGQWYPENLVVEAMLTLEMAKREESPEQKRQLLEQAEKSARRSIKHKIKMREAAEKRAKDVLDKVRIMRKNPAT